MDLASSTEAPGQHKIEGGAQYEAAIDTIIGSATRTLRVFDRSLSREYNSVRRHDLLRGFLLASRVNRVYVVVHDTVDIQLYYPRLCNLIRQFSHSLAIRLTQPRARKVYDPFSLADDANYVHRFHYDQPRGLLALGDPGGAKELLGRYEEIWDSSDPVLNATTLGL